MLKTSQAYQAAIVGSPRRIELLTVIDISDPDMQYGAVTMDSIAPWSKPAELHDKVLDAPARYTTLEPGRWLLDGASKVFPDDYKVTEHMGVANDRLSGEDGNWPPEQPAFIQQPIEHVDVLQAFSLFFSTDPVDGVPMDFTVEVLAGGVAYYTQEITGNTETEMAFTGFTVYTPETIRITVTRWSLPGRRLRCVDIIPGIYEQWGARMLASFSCVMQGDFSCLSLPYGTLELTIDNKSRRFEPRSKDGLFQSIEERQGIEAYIGVRTASGAVERCRLGVFYQAGDGWKTGDNGLTISWSLVDIIGLLASRTFIPPAVLPTTLKGWIQALVSQMGDNFAGRYRVDPDYADMPITAGSVDDVTGKKCGDILRWACMAAGVWPRADQETGFLAAEPLWNQGAKVTLANLTGYPVMSANKSLAALIFKLADESGTEFVISGNATASEETVTIDNPFIRTQAQALAAARLILSCYGGNVIETTGRGDPASEIGDVDTIWLDESQATTARRMMQTFAISNGALQGCQSKLLQADGSYLFEEFAVIRQSGKWKAPANVKDDILRAVLISGGQGGSRGEDGFVSGSGNLPGSGVTAGYGEQGLDGVGGRVWYGVIKINPEQEFEVQLGEGGAPSDTPGVPGAMGGVTTMTAGGVTYSSADGDLYEGGYTDIANGQVFARTGVAAPLAGSGDGGAGGAGGDPGEGYWEDLYWDWIDPSTGNPAHKGWDFVITKEPGPGHPGVAGATGVVMVTWDKADVSDSDTGGAA